jgi:hypothetical protein
MQTHEFDGPAGLEEVSNRLARASRHPVHVDLGTEYSEAGVARLDQEKLDGGADRLASVEPQPALHAVWNNRDDERAYLGSERYNLIQHREVLDAIREALGRTDGEVEKGAVRDYGDHVNGVIVFGGQERATIDVGELVDHDPDAGPFQDGYVPPEGNEGGDAWAPGVRDRLGLGMRFYNSFNGRSGFGGSTMGYRFICQNWMVWGEETIAEKGSYHIKGGDEAPGVDADYFEELIYEVFDEKEGLEAIVQESARDELPLEWAPGLLEEAGFGPQYAAEIAGRLLGYEQPRPGHTTRWHVYNAATAYLDSERVEHLGPERYDHYQDAAWSVMEAGVERPEDPPADMEELRELAA